MNFEENTVRYAQISAALSRSRFRSRFRLGLKDRQYICDRGWETMRRHAAELVEERLAPAFIPNDGKQTPMRGHPVFIAQHATACCCRGCLEKWHKIPSGRALTAAEQEYIVGMLLFWMQREMYFPRSSSSWNTSSFTRRRKNAAFTKRRGLYYDEKAAKIR